LADHKLTRKQQGEVLRLLAERVTYATIARRMGITPQSVAHYAEKHREQLEAAWAEQNERLVAQGLANREARLGWMQWQADKLRGVVEAREDDPNLAKYTGGHTGFVKLVTTQVPVGRGMTETVETPEYDSALSKDLMKLYGDFAAEMGERKARAEVTVNPNHLSLTELVALAGETPEWERDDALIDPQTGRLPGELAPDDDGVGRV
jgi:hypothetical protein